MPRQQERERERAQEPEVRPRQQEQERERAEEPTVPRQQERERERAEEPTVPRQQERERERPMRAPKPPMMGTTDTHGGPAIAWWLSLGRCHWVPDSRRIGIRGS